MEEAQLAFGVGRTVLARLEGGKAMEISLLKPGLGLHSMKVVVGNEKPGSDWSDLYDLDEAQAPQMISLRGMAFTGMRGALLEFDHKYGVHRRGEAVPFRAEAGNEDRE